MAALNAAIAASRLQRAVAVKSPSPGASPKGASSPSPSSPQAKLDAMLGELRAASPARPGAAGRRHRPPVLGPKMNENTGEQKPVWPFYHFFTKFPRKLFLPQQDYMLKILAM